MRHILPALLTALAVGWTAPALAAIDFESVTDFLQTDPDQNFTLDGLSISATSYYGVQSGLFLTDNPTHYLVYFAGDPNALTMSFGQPFDLKGFDFGGSENVITPDSLVLTGYLYGGGTVSKTLDFHQASASSFDAAALSAFRNLSHVVFGSMDDNYGYAWIDNIQIAAVPEPTSGSMILAGLGLLALAGRRTKFSATSRMC